MKDSEQDAFARAAEAENNTHPPLVKIAIQDKAELERLYPKGGNGKSTMKTVEKEIVIVAYVNHVDCPNCNAPQMGFLNDPRGGDYECEECGKPYHIPKNAPVNFG